MLNVILTSSLPGFIVASTYADNTVRIAYARIRNTAKVAYNVWKRTELTLNVDATTTNAPLSKSLFFTCEVKVNSSNSSA